jgi:hypothetical protein
MTERIRLRATVDAIRACSSHAVWSSLAIAVLAVVSPSPAGAEPTPTVIVDIHARGHAHVQALREHSDVRWSAEFGNELLLGVDEKALALWLERADARPGPPRLAPDEVVVRDKVCPRQDPQPALAVVGGFSILRKPPALVRATMLPGVAGAPLPSDGVVAREANNVAGGKGIVARNRFIEYLVARVDGDRWYGTVESLSAIDRNSFSPDIEDAHDWILAEFGDLGLETSSHQFTLSGSGCSPAQSPVALRNPIGMKRGHDPQASWIVVGGHYDSRNHVRCDGSALPQPGANDNASGCAGVIELARVFANIPTVNSIVFACFSGEEQGLVGSYYYVQSLVASGDIDRVIQMINLDMIGHAVDDSLTARAETTVTHQGSLNLYSAMAATYAPELNLVLSTSTQGYSDHWYFLQAGVPAMFTWENGAGIYPHYHRETDLPNNMLRARELAGGILKMDTAVLATLAEALSDIFGDGFDEAKD